MKLNRNERTMIIKSLKDSIAVNKDAPDVLDKQALIEKLGDAIGFNKKKEEIEE